MPDSPSIPALPPDEIAGYRVVRALTPRQSYLALAPGDRLVVLKALEADCLLEGHLHPSIRDRLARVRELAHMGVACLHGVERDGATAYLIWEFAPGQTFDAKVAAMTSPAELTLLAREVALAVESLHALGIVHGRLHAANVIIDDVGRVRLTHLSPLLYDDPTQDTHDAVEMLTAAAARRGWDDAPVGRAVAEIRSAGGSLAQLRARLAAGPDAAAAEEADDLPTSPERSHRRRSLLYAALAAASGLAVAATVARVATKHSPGIMTPPEAGGALAADQRR